MIQSRWNATSVTRFFYFFRSAHLLNSGWWINVPLNACFKWSLQWNNWKDSPKKVHLTHLLGSYSLLAETEAKKKRDLCSKSIKKGERMHRMISVFILSHYNNLVEYARIHANDAIRKKNESLNYLKLAARIDGYDYYYIIILLYYYIFFLYLLLYWYYIIIILDFYAIQLFVSVSCRNNNCFFSF
jgi:hypothetical protein